ncbi:hypothetical protein DPMN_002826 [Dreissena polymorpha]|uniref:Uncharacterized protein n=1 Tax=Dreissena polymorpha TaxID=45954 RepID=A0A9D4RU72_DREPO|nr:hypothetical protein DPMN_002826 [Dreissena polymorpha]
MFYKYGPLEQRKQPLRGFSLFAHLRGFHDDWTKNVTSRVHVIQMTGTIFRLNSHIKETNVLTKFHEKWAKNVTSREEKCPPTGGHVFSQIWIIFELVRDINKTNVLTNFHDDWAKIVTSRVFTRKTAPPTGSHVFQRTGTTFELNQHIIKTNILTKLHEDWARNVTSTVFKLDQDFIGTKLLTKFHEDWTINVASRTVTKAHLSNQRTTLTDGQTDGYAYDINRRTDGRTDGRTDRRTDGRTDRRGAVTGIDINSRSPKQEGLAWLTVPLLTIQLFQNNQFHLSRIEVSTGPVYLSQPLSLPTKQEGANRNEDIPF